MNPLEFLAVVLPSSGHGTYCAAELTKKKEHLFVENLDDFYPKVGNAFSLPTSNLNNFRTIGKFFYEARVKIWKCEPVLTKHRAIIDVLHCEIFL